MVHKALNSTAHFDLPARPDFSIESVLMAMGARVIAGTDEAGRGPLAGPVVAAAVVLDAHNIPGGMDDSKRMTKAMRLRAFSEIFKTARAVAFCSSSAQEVDGHDIRKASLEAMSRAIAGLAISVDHVLVDGRDVPTGLSSPATALIKGDQRSLSIAAASIVAKVIRDSMMEACGGQWSGYGFARHNGYGTPEHFQAIAALGPIERIHRFTFAPICKK